MILKQLGLGSDQPNGLGRERGATERAVMMLLRLLVE